MKPFLAITSVIAIGIAASPAASAPLNDQILIDTSAPVGSFTADNAFGAALDGGSRGEVLPIYQPRNIALMRRANLPRVSYRLRTELGIEAWHWTRNGTWSEPGRRQGYWTGDSRAAGSSVLTYGFKLPRRGDTIDQANNKGYSRLDDGDEATFWKSNPYLDPVLIGGPVSSPQWIVVELDKPSSIDVMRIAWATPYAKRYSVQYWTGVDEYDPEGQWRTFVGGQVEDGRGGEAVLKLGAAPPTRFLRLLLTESSRTAPDGATDARDAIGYAVSELSAGQILADGSLTDVIRHAASPSGQTVMHVSSTDPWHRAIDKDLDLEQPSPKMLSRSGVTNGLSLMVPVGVLYDTPDNAAAELRYLRNIGVPFDQVELGEEPDGQLVAPSDYGALYLLFFDRLHQLFPGVTFGGPSLQSGVSDTWLDANPNRSWNGQFITYLHDRRRLSSLGFFSFERYPFDDICGSMSTKLLQQSRMMESLFIRLTAEGVPRGIPWIITEYGFSAFSGRAMVELPSALLNADMVADFLTRGGTATYLFGYGPNVPINQQLACAERGNMMLWESKGGAARWPMPAYHGARMMTRAWAAPHGRNKMYRASSLLKDSQGTPLVSAYPLRRPDGRWSVMLINRSTVPLSAHIDFGAAAPTGPVEVTRYSARQYHWDPKTEHPDRDLPPERFRLSDWKSAIDLPGLSMTVSRSASTRCEGPCAAKGSPRLVSLTVPTDAPRGGSVRTSDDRSSRGQTSPVRLARDPGQGSWRRRRR